MDMIIGRSHTPLNSSRTIESVPGETTTRAKKCRMSVGIARLYLAKCRPTDAVTETWAGIWIGPG
jgi:hypothetical protein